MIDVATFLGNLSSEVGRLSDVAAGLDGLLGDIAEASGHVSMATLTQLQDMDHLRQALGDLRVLTRNCADLARAGDLPAMPKRRLTQGVTLEAMRVACLQDPTDPLAEPLPFCNGRRECAPDLF